MQLVSGQHLVQHSGSLLKRHAQGHHQEITLCKTVQTCLEIQHNSPRLNKQQAKWHYLGKDNMAQQGPHVHLLCP